MLRECLIDQIVPYIPGGKALIYHEPAFNNHDARVALAIYEGYSGDQTRTDDLSITINRADMEGNFSTVVQSNATAQAWVLANVNWASYPLNSQGLIPLAKRKGHSLVVYSYGGIQGRNYEEYPDIQLVSGFSSNANEQQYLLPEDSIHNPIITTEGLTGGRRGWGNALEFWDASAYGGASSWSNGVIAGKLLAIKEARNCSWWEARFCARMTASGGGVWNIHDGWGSINKAAAIAYAGSIDPDPFI